MIDLLDPNKVISRMFEAGQFADMQNYCSKMLEKNPKDLVALQNLALSFLHLEKFSECIEICDKVLSDNKYDNYALTLKIHALENLGKFDEVLHCCDLLLEKNKDDTWAMNTVGLAFNELNRYEEACEIFEKVLKIDNRNITSLINKAISLSFLGENQKSIEYYDQAQKIDPIMKELSIAKSREFEKLGLKDEAFLAAQGVLLEEMKKIKSDAVKNKCSVFHQFCEMEFAQSKKEKLDWDNSKDKFSDDSKLGKT